MALHHVLIAYGNEDVKWTSHQSFLHHLLEEVISFQV